MIITITGKPCSGKSTAGKLFAETYNFERLSTGDMHRQLVKQHGFDNLIEFQKTDLINEVDRLIDSSLVEIGKTRAEENLIIDSRLAWHFIPNSFKVFIDIDWDIAGQRLLQTNRDTEQKFTNAKDATKSLQERFNIENDRYLNKYGVNNLVLDNYDFVISSNNNSPEEIVKQIYDNYQKFIKTH